MPKFLDPKNDFAFKRIFGTEQNKPVLIQFLNDILGTTVRKVEFLPTVLDPEVAARKQSIVDVLCKDQSGDQYIVEMQVAHSEAFVERAQFYACRAYASQMRKGQGYEFLRPVIFLAITDFIMFKDKPGYQSDHVVLDKEHHTHDLKGLSFTFLELPKFKKEFHELKTSTDRWMYFFKYAADAKLREFESLSRESSVIHQAFHTLDQCYWTEAEIGAYEREQKNQMDAEAIILGAQRLGLEAGRQAGLQQGRQEGRQEGLQEGRQEGRQEGLQEGLERGREEGVKEGEERGRKKAMLALINDLLLTQMDIPTICRITKLSREEVEAALDSTNL